MSDFNVGSSDMFVMLCRLSRNRNMYYLHKDYYIGTYHKIIRISMNSLSLSLYFTKVEVEVKKEHIFMVVFLILLILIIQRGSLFFFNSINEYVRVQYLHHRTE